MDTQGNLYFLTNNTKPTALRSTAIPAHFIRELLDTCAAQHQILIFDCHFTKEFTDREYPERTSAVDLSLWFEGKERIILSAGTLLKTPTSPGGIVKTKKTFDFTSYLVQGLKTGKADKNGDGFISIDELYEYAAGTITLNNPDYLPQKWGTTFRESTVIAKSIRGKIEPVKLPESEDKGKGNKKNETREKPTYIITKHGWKHLKKGTEYTFYFLYVAINLPATITGKSVTLLERESQNIQNYINRHLKGSGGKLWLSKKENHEHIILFPYNEKNGKTVLRCGFLLMLYKKIFDYEESCLDQPLSLKLALHIGNTPYYPNPENIPLVSSDINFIFHFGEYISPDDMYLTQDVQKLLPFEYKHFCIPAGNFTSKEIFKLQCKYHEKSL
jgi:hypothetical protein